MIVESLIGSALGGLMRIAPEVLKLVDRKNERGHELQLLDAERQIVTLQQENAMRDDSTRLQSEELTAIIEATRGQAEMSKAGGWFVSAAAALVRPLVTYWMVFLYSATKVASYSIALRANADWAEATLTLWGEQDWGLLSMILTFWFVGRVWERERSRAA